MPSSLVKFANRTSAGGQRLYWGRSDEDGAPFRGPFPPLMTDAEYETKAVRVRDFKFGFFDVSDPAQGRVYCDVMEAIANGWYQLRMQEHFWQGTTKHYVEWFEYFMEDGSRTPYLSPGVVEMANAQAAAATAL